MEPENISVEKRINHSMKPGHLLFDKDNICFYQPELRRRDWSGIFMHLLIIFLFIFSGSPFQLNAQTTVTSSITSSSDDLEEAGANGASPGNMFLNSGDLEMVQDDAAGNAGTQKIGLRFNSISIPKGATITNSYITFTAVGASSPNTNSGVTNLTIRGQAADNPGTFTTTLYDLSNRGTTSASTAWSSIAAWTTGVSYNTPALNTIVQELVNRSGWSSNNSMVFIITGSGHRSAESWDNAGTNQPILTIQYTTMSLSGVATSTSVPSGSDGAVDLSVTSGTSPYTYSWSNAATTQDISGLTGGTYTVTVTDANGATASSAFQVLDGIVKKQLYLSGAGQLMDRNDPTVVSEAIKSTASLYSPSIGSLNSEFRSFNNSNTFYGTYTSPDGPNRMLLVGISVRNRNDIFVISVKYNNLAMTEVATIDNGENALVYIYRLVDPPVGAYYLDVDFNSTVTRAAVIGIATLHGVHQTTPTGTPSSAIGSSLNMSLNIASTPGDLVVSVVSKRNATSSFTTPQTQEWNAYLNETRGGGNSTVATGTTTTMNWTATNGSGNAMVGVAIKPAGGNPTTSFTQSPAMCSNFTIKAGAVTIKNFININYGTMPANPNITARLKYGSTNIITISNPTYNSTSGLLTWTGNLGSDITVPAGQSVVLEITTNQPLVEFTIQYDHSTKPSSVEFNTSTFINVSSVQVYNAASPGGSLITSASPGSVVYVRTTASDPFGSTDITSATNSIVSPASGPFAATAVSSSGCSRTFEYTWTTPATAGDYTIRGTAKEGYENTVSFTGQTVFSVCPLTVTNSVTQPTSCISSNGSIALTVTGAGGPYTWSWTRTSPAGSGSGSGTSLTSLAAGTYTITVTSVRGCTGTTTATLNIPAPPTSSAALSHITCFGGTTGAIVQTVAGGSAPYTYVWSGSAVTTKDRSSLTAGTYTVTITNAGGCTASFSHTITQPAAMTVSNSFSQPTCTLNSTITLTPGGGGTSSPYTFNWTRTSPSGSGTGSGTSISNLTYGVYAITVTSSIGCTATTSATLVQPLPPAVSGFITDATCFGGNNGAINQLLNGGTAPFTYIWTGGATTANRSALTAGSYSVTVTDGKSCTAARTYTVAQPTQISVTPTVTQPGCITKGSIGIVLSGGNGPYSTDWSDVPGTINSVSRTDLIADTYNLTVTDSRGCTNTYNTTLTAPTCAPALQVCVSNIPETFSTTADPTVTNYTWTVPSGAVIISGQGTTSIRVNWSGVSPGSSEICVSTSNSCGPGLQYCRPVNTKGITPVITSSSPCIGSDLVLFASGGNLFSWAGPNGFLSTSANPIIHNATSIHAGLYQVTVTDADGCQSTGSVNVTVSDAPMTTIQSYNATCGASNGFIDMSVYSGTMPFAYTWSNGTTTQDNYALGRGNYIVTVTDANGCMNTASASVGEVNGPNVVLTGMNVLCHGTSTGSIESVVSGGTTPYRFFWSQGATSEDLSNLMPGLYRVTVVDANGCGDVESVTIFQPDQLFADQSASDVSCFGGSTGSVTINVNGGVSPYSILWSGGSTTFQRTNLSSGIYTATVTDANGCQQILSVPLNQPASALSSVLSANDVTCFSANNGSINQTVTGGTRPYYYVWSSDLNPTFMATSEDIDSLQNGMYRVTVTDSRGCTASSAVMVSQPGVLAIALTATNLSCFKSQNGAISQVVTGGNAPYTYLWSDGQTTQNRTSLQAGVYTVTVTDIKGCTASSSRTITEPAEMTPIATPTHNDCNSIASGSIVLTITGGTSPFTYSWSNGATTKDINNLLAGNYIVTITDNNNCLNILQIQINEGTPFASDEFIKHVSCNGGSDGGIDYYVRGGVGPYTFIWSTGATTKDISNLSEGAYQVTFTDTEGCSASGFFIVSEPTFLYTANLIYEPNCYGGNDGTITAYPTGGVAPYKLAWSTGSSDQTITVPKGTYTVTVTDKFGCEASVTSQVSEPDQLTLSATTTAPCPGQSNGYVSLNVSGGTLPYTFAWSDGGNAIQVRSGLAAGSYTVTLTDANGCLKTTSFSLTPISGILQSAAPSCGTNESGQVITNPDGEMYAVISGGNLPHTYTWSNGSSAPFIGGLSAGTYTVSVFSGGCGIVMSASITGSTCTPPIAIDDQFVTEINVPIINGSVALNDHDPNNEYPLTFSPLGFINPEVGMIEWDDTYDGSFSFYPAQDFTGTIEIPYQVCDTLNLCVRAKLNIIVSRPILGLSKAVSAGPILNGGNGYDFTYRITAENFSHLTLNNLQITDKLDTAFAGAISWSIIGVSSQHFTVNPAYNGISNINLLSGSNQLTGLGSGTIDVLIRIVPGTNLGPYYNTARITGSSPAFTSLSDLSQNGYDPDPDNDGDPTNNNIPTPLLLCPIVEITGSNSICVGEITTLNSVPNGTWVSSNPEVAQVNNSGVIVGISAGTATFTFIESISGCISNATAPVTIKEKPVIQITGDTSICATSNTFLTPNSGGFWTSSNTNVATILINGMVTGQNPGTAAFYFTNILTGCTSLASDSIRVRSNPDISFMGDSIICVGTTTNVTPTSGGIWTSSNATVASVTQDGLVTGVSNGITQLSFVTNTGCSKNKTLPVIVKGNTFVQVGGNSQICIGTTTQLLPASGGTWTSTQPSIASVTSGGLVTGLTEGFASFYFTDSNSGCVSILDQVITILPSVTPSFTGPNEICAGTNTSVWPSSGGVWFSSNDMVATVTAAGIVTGVGPGNVTLTYTSSSSGCTFQLSPNLKIKARPAITLNNPGPICQGGNISLLPGSGGTWVSSDPLVASVDNNGLVTSVNQGAARFIFTDDSTGCSSLASDLLTIHPKPSVAIIGHSTICKGEQTSLQPNLGGTWESNNNTIAIVDNSGKVLGLSAGQARFFYTDLITGCQSDLTSIITVDEGPEVMITGSNEICAGFQTTLSPVSGGVWTSNNINVAVVSNSGVVTGIGTGQVSFVFTSSASACRSDATPLISVTKCILNDFNITKVDVSVSGDVSTNDIVPAGYTYKTIPILLSKPATGLPVINVYPNGTYSFITNVSGIYEYSISLCQPGNNGICIQSILTILVNDVNRDDKIPFAIDDRAVTSANSNPALPGDAVRIPTLANDRCIYNTSCTLNPLSVLVTVPPQNGFTSVAGNGDIIYTPGPGFIGTVTLRYRVCIDGEPTNCGSAIQTIEVLSREFITPNSTHAVDDLFNTSRETAVSGNVLANDFDIESDIQLVIPKGSSLSPVAIAGGSYFIDQSGSFTFTPANGFSGVTSFVYIVCDDNITSKCDSATVYLYVSDDLTLKIRVYLEGALMKNGQLKGSHGRPLMRDNLRVSPYTGSNHIPAKDPYKFRGGFVDIAYRYQHKGAGIQVRFDSITDINSVFNVTGENAIVDWVFVEIRSKMDSSELLMTRSGLLQRDGDIVDLDGFSPLRTPGIGVGQYYIVVRHRNHLGVMSKIVNSYDLIDFTSIQTPVFDFGTSLNNGYNYTGLSTKNDVISGYRALWAGDFDGNKKLKFVNPDDDLNVLFFDVMGYPGNTSINANYDLSYGYLQSDYDMDGKVKFDNPNDDKNLLFSQILLHQLNLSILSNFNFIIEQVPPARSDL